jgi:hypothetical protein
LAVLLTACVSAEGYRQHMDLLVGQTTDQLQMQWGIPDSTTRLDDGSEMWVYHRQTENRSGGYWTTQEHTRVEEYKDKDGTKQKRKVTYSSPYYEPLVVTHTFCETRFIVTPDHHVKAVTFEGDGCVDMEIDKDKGETKSS